MGEVLSSQTHWFYLLLCNILKNMPEYWFVKASTLVSFKIITFKSEFFIFIFWELHCIFLSMLETSWVDSSKSNATFVKKSKAKDVLQCFFQPLGGRWKKIPEFWKKIVAPPTLPKKKQFGGVEKFRRFLIPPQKMFSQNRMGEIEVLFQA